MRLLPADAQEHSDWEDGLWVEKPGYPQFTGSWIHPPPRGHVVPEFEFEEGHEKNKNEPGPVFYIGSGEDCHVRLGTPQMPEKVCRVFKEGRRWLLEALLPRASVHLNGQALSVGKHMALWDGNTFTLGAPPTTFAYRICIRDEDNWYIDAKSEKDYPNKYPARFPYRSSLPEAPPAPEELRRLAWQTDQMRKRSEEDQVRVGDWSAFSQYVKRHYYKYGIECISWAEHGRHLPVEPPLPVLQPKVYPSWISDLVCTERQLPGVDPSRVAAFESCLRLSGRKVAPQMEFKDGPPRLEDLYTDCAIFGSAVLSNSTVPLQARGGAVHLQEALSGKTQRVPSQVQQQTSASTRLREVNPHVRQSFKTWLEGMDDSLYLMKYHDDLEANFDSVEQIHEIYFRNGELSKTFFEDTGITKLGHKRIFEKWFRDFCR